MGNAIKRNSKFDNQADDTSEHDTDLLLECVTFQCRKKKSLGDDPQKSKQEQLVNEQKLRKLKEDEEAKQRQSEALRAEEKDKIRAMEDKKAADEKNKRTKIEEMERKKLEKEMAAKEKMRKMEEEKAEAARIRREKEDGAKRKKEEAKRKELEEKQRRREKLNEICNLVSGFLNRREKSAEQIATDEKRRKAKEEQDRINKEEKARKKLEKATKNEQKLREKEEEKRKKKQKKEEAENEKPKFSTLVCCAPINRMLNKLADEEKKSKKTQKQKVPDEQTANEKLKDKEKGDAQKAKEIEAKKAEKKEQPKFSALICCAPCNKLVNEMAKEEEKESKMTRDPEKKGVVTDQAIKQTNEPSAVSISQQDSDLELKCCGIPVKSKKKPITDDGRAALKLEEKPQSQPKGEDKIKPDPSEVSVLRKEELPVEKPAKADPKPIIKLETESDLTKPAPQVPCPSPEIIPQQTQSAQTEPVICLSKTEKKDIATLVTPTLSYDSKDTKEDDKFIIKKELEDSFAQTESFWECEENVKKEEMKKEEFLKTSEIKIETTNEIEKEPSHKDIADDLIKESFENKTELEDDQDVKADVLKERNLEGKPKLEDSQNDMADKLNEKNIENKPKLEDFESLPKPGPTKGSLTSDAVKKEIEELERVLNIKPEPKDDSTSKTSTTKPIVFSTVVEKIDASTQVEASDLNETGSSNRPQESRKRDKLEINKHERAIQTDAWRFDYEDSSEKIMSASGQKNEVALKPNELPHKMNQGTQTECDCYIETSIAEIDVKKTVLQRTARKVVTRGIATQTEMCTCNYEESSSSYTSTECIGFQETKK